MITDRTKLHETIIYCQLPATPLLTAPSHHQITAALPHHTMYSTAAQQLISMFPSRHTQQTVTWNTSILLSITVCFTQHCAPKSTCSHSTRTWNPFCQRPLHL